MHDIVITKREFNGLEKWGRDQGRTERTTQN